MSNARTILITNSNAAVYLWQGKHLHALQEFSNDDAGRAALAENLARDVRTVTDVLVDVIEEEFRTDRMPHVRGNDHEVLLRRRAEQAYRLTPYRLGIVLTRRIDGKREDEALLSALTNPDLVKPWIDVLLKLKIALRGIYSVSQLYSEMLKPLSITDKRALIITRQKNSGMRQAFFHDQKLKMSRLSPAPGSDAAAHATQLLTEVDKTQRYLARLKLMDRDDVLAVHCVSDGGDLAALRNTCRDSEKLKFHFHALAALPGGAGLPVESTNFSDPLFLHLLRVNKPQRDYASAVERRYSVYRLARFAFNGASVAAILAATTWSGMNVIDARLMQEFNGTADRLATDLQSRYEKVMEDVPKTPVSAQSLQVGVEIAHTLMNQRTLPHAMLRALSSALTGVPQLRVESIDWRATADPATVAFDRAVTAATPAAESAEASPEGETPPANDLYQVVQIKGSLVSFDGDYRKAFENVNRFMAALRKTTNMVSVKAEEMPLNINPDALLQGTAGLREKDQTAVFIVQAVLKVRHEIR